MFFFIVDKFLIEGISSLVNDRVGYVTGVGAGRRQRCRRGHGAKQDCPSKISSRSSSKTQGSSPMATPASLFCFFLPASTQGCPLAARSPPPAPSWAPRDSPCLWLLQLLLRHARGEAGPAGMRPGHAALH